MTTRHGARAGLDIQTPDSHQICSQSWYEAVPSSLGILNYIQTNNCQNSTISTVQFAFEWNFQLIGPPASAGYKDWYIYLLQPGRWWVRQWGQVQLGEPISTLVKYFYYICVIEGGLVKDFVVRICQDNIQFYQCLESYLINQLLRPRSRFKFKSRFKNYIQCDVKKEEIIS